MKGFRQQKYYRDMLGRRMAGRELKHEPLYSYWNMTTCEWCHGGISGRVASNWILSGQAVQVAPWPWGIEAMATWRPGK